MTIRREGDTDTTSIYFVEDHINCSKGGHTDKAAGVEIPCKGLLYASFVFRDEAEAEALSIEEFSAGHDIVIRGVRPKESYYPLKSELGTLAERGLHYMHPRQYSYDLLRSW